MSFDSHWGKYDGPIAALAERWVMDGSYGDHDWSDEGEGSVLWVGLTTLSWDDARYLMGDDFTMTAAELDTLAHEIGTSQGICFSWDDRGFCYAMAFQTIAEVQATAEAIDAINLGMSMLEDSDEA